MEKETCPARLFAVYGKIYSSRGLVLLLRTVDVVAVIAVVAVFGICAYFGFFESIYNGAMLLVLCGAPFALVSIMRRVISAPRPYEVYDLGDLTEKRPYYKLGRSFPSRHVFSAFLIGTVAFEYSFVFGILTLALGVMLAVIRVLLGIHFVRDVICGAAIGVLLGIISVLIL